MVTVMEAPQNMANTGNTYPKTVMNWINGALVAAESAQTVDKFNPATGAVLTQVAKSQTSDAEKAVEVAKQTFDMWSRTNIVERANILRRATQIMEARKPEIAAIVALETGKSLNDAAGEVGGAIELGYFIAGEGRRFYGKTTTSGVPNRSAMTVRQPAGVCALIIAANTPIANVAWKAYPALLCGNSAVMKTSEDIPYTAVWFAQILKEAGLPDGVFNVIQGLGPEAGGPLVEHKDVAVVSFTGSVGVGRWIQTTAGNRLAKVCLELGGKNALVVCDDADLDDAAQMAANSAFTNAGQRCASGSRMVIVESVYEAFKAKMLEKTNAMTIGSTNEHTFGPVINERQLTNMLNAIEQAVAEGATLVCGGKRLQGGHYENGYYLESTILENVDPNSAIAQEELFGPITCLFKVKNFEEAIALTNNSEFGLTAAIHTKNMHRVQEFTNRVRTGVISVNGPTYGSEPHMPFGGLGVSGNGWREPGSEALDVYSELKTVYVRHNPELV